MAEAADEAAKGPPAARDARSDWIRGRVCSSLRVRDEQVQKLFAGEAK